MSYAHYTLPDGREAGYGVEAICDSPECKVEIDRGLYFLCGDHPDGHRDSEAPGCGKYFCNVHQYAPNHNCPNTKDCPLCEGEGLLSGGHACYACLGKGIVSATYEPDEDE